MRWCWVLFVVGLVSCGLGFDFDRYGTATEPSRYAVRGNVDGLEGPQLTLMLNGADPIVVTANGPFSFPVTLANDQAYVVTADTGSALEACTVERASDKVRGADVTDIAVHCASTEVTLKGLTLSGASLAPKFSPQTVTYGARVLASLSRAPTTTITATATSAQARITIGGVPVESGVASAVTALPFMPSPLPIVVTAPGGQMQTYAVGVSVALNDYLKASNTRKLAKFGYSVALSGDTIAVGAPGESSGAKGVNGDQADESQPGSGAVYVFRWGGMTWVQEAYLKASNTRMNTQFGTSVSLLGDTLAVGSSGEHSNAKGVNADQTDGSASDSGAAYVFRRTGTVWAQEAYLKASNTRPGALFGGSVSLAADRLAVGSPAENSSAVGVNSGLDGDASALSAGAVYVFRRSGTTWSQEAYVKASNTRAFSQFGGSVSLSDDTLVVGASVESSGATGIGGDQASISELGSGAVYVFRRGATTWAQEAYVKASNTRKGARFGYSVALSGNALAVGSPRETSDASGVNGNQTSTAADGAGAVYLFRRNGIAWSQEAYVKASRTRANAELGQTVALDGDTLVVSSPNDPSSVPGANGDPNDTSADRSGAVYLFRRSGGAWLQTTHLKASNPRPNADFGCAMAVSSTSLAVGSFLESSNATGVNGDQNNTNADPSGAVYAFGL
jgi:hypothetical protein